MANQQHEVGDVSTGRSLRKPVFLELPPPTSQAETRLEGQRPVLPAASVVRLEKEPRVPALDGLRGVAVLLVLAFHFMDIGYPKIFGPVGFAIYNFGWTGVDLFFVLSGFLITGILFDAKGLKGYFSSFYGRRAVRIFPPYFLVVGLVLYAIPSIWPWLFHKGELAPVGPQWMYWTYLTNFYFAKHNAYGVLGHTWSLCVEEQFYLCWPLMVVLFSRRRLMQTCVAVAIVSIPLRAYFLHQDSNSFDNIWKVYLWTFTRTDELLMGSFVSLAARSQCGVELLKRFRWFAIPAAAAIVALWVFKKQSEHIPSLRGLSFLTENSTKYTFVGLFFAAALSTIITTSPTTLLNRFLHIGWLRWFGRYSYGLYLFHVPLCETVKEYWGREPHGWVMAQEYLIFAVGSIGLALLSWHGLEKHMLKLKKFFPMPTRRASLAAEPAPHKDELLDDLDLATLHVG